jgi:ketosteroid isomerase-like protein
MTDRHAIQAAVAELYDHRNRGDMNAMLACLHPECRFRIAGTERLGAFTKVADNHDAIRESVSALVADWDLSSLENVSLNVDGNTIFVHRAGSVRHIPTSVSFNTEFMEKITFKDGKISEYIQFIDTYHVAGIVGLISI